MSVGSLFLRIPLIPAFSTSTGNNVVIGFSFSGAYISAGDGVLTVLPSNEAAYLSLSTDYLNYGMATPGDTLDLGVTLYNSGFEDILITDVACSSPFINVDDNMKLARHFASQNKIFGHFINLVTDLASNHPYHIALDRYSKKIRMRPNEEGVSTKWFYERARGQYLTGKRQRRTDAKKRQFEKEYPRKQLFNKTDLTKYENTWN